MKVPGGRGLSQQDKLRYMKSNTNYTLAAGSSMSRSTVMCRALFGEILGAGRRYLSGDHEFDNKVLQRYFSGVAIDRKAKTAEKP